MSDNYDGKMDKECIALCDAINRLPGLRTIGSCCGHGEQTFKIWFIVKAPDYLPILLYYTDSCHVGFDWDCLVTTDCAMNPVHHYIQSRCVGDEAYRQAQEIADAVNQVDLQAFVAQTLAMASVLQSVFAPNPEGVPFENGKGTYVE